MAISIRPIPILKGKIAERFVNIANRSKSSKQTVDFTKEVKTAGRILSKAKI